jgi:uncharacterized protein YggE
MDHAPTPTPGARRRRRRLTAAAIGSLVALAVASGAAGAVVARHGGPGATSDTFFVPGAALGIGPGGAANGNGATGFSAPSIGAQALPMSPLAPGVASSAPGVPGVASGIAYPGVASSAAYPWWGPPCVASSPTQLSGSLIVASGTAPLPPGTAQAHYALTAGINEQATSGDVAAAVARARSTVDAVVAALAKAGVPSSAIHPSFINVWASGGKPVTPATPEPVRQVNVNATVDADIGDAAAIQPALDAAIGGGAQNVNVGPSGTAVAQPNQGAVDAAVSSATGQAHTLAAAAAKAAGVGLGSVKSLTVSPPAACGWGAGGPQLVVTATVGYEVK